jgi:hypothetical protein
MYLKQDVPKRIKVGYPRLKTVFKSLMKATVFLFCEIRVVHGSVAFWVVTTYRRVSYTENEGSRFSGALVTILMYIL